MYFEISRKELLTPLKMVASVVETKQSLPILGHILIKVSNGNLQLTATDAEVEMACSLPLSGGLDTPQEAEITVPRKFFEIVRSLSDANPIQITTEEGNQVVVRSGKSRFVLATLPAEDFPASPKITDGITFQINQSTLKRMLSKTAFSIAVNDVRYYLNGLLLEIAHGHLSLVATDGHRMAVAQQTFSEDYSVRIIIPRKAILELLKLLADNEEEITIEIDEHHIKFNFNDQMILSSKLIDGTFPDWQIVVPHSPDKSAKANTAELKQALSRVSIVSTDRHKGVRISLEATKLTVDMRNPQQEEASEELEVDYEGDEMEIGFNASYILDVLNVAASGLIKLNFSDSNSSVLITEENDEEVRWIIMPMRL